MPDSRIQPCQLERILPAYSQLRWMGRIVRFSAGHKLAETIVQSTAEKNQKMLTMDSMQSMTSKDVANGATYLSVMEQNLSVLKEALG